MIIKNFTPEWKLWIWSNIVNGFNKESVFNILLNNGFDYSLIRNELGIEPTNSLIWRRQYSQESLNTPYEVELYPYNKFICDNPRAYRIENNQMEIYHFPELLTYEECDELLSITNKKLNKKNQAAHKLDMSLDISKTINKRLCDIIGLSEDFGEDIFIQKYSSNVEYGENVDYMLPELTDNLFQTKGQRVWSVHIWLNNVNEGGHLTLKSIDKSIKPVKGEATMWKNIHHDGSINENTSYVHNSFTDGDKYVLVKYFRERGDVSVEVLESKGPTEIEFEITEIK
jgi:prolyl 4-hydroxylase